MNTKTESIEWGARLTALLDAIQEVSEQIEHGEIPRSVGRRRVDELVKDYYDASVAEARSRMVFDPDYQTLRSLFTSEPET